MSFFEIFQPGLRYLREEKERQKMLVAEPKFGKKGGPLGIDLEGGKATFAMPAKPGQDLPQSVEPESSSVGKGEAHTDVGDIGGPETDRADPDGGGADEAEGDNARPVGDRATGAHTDGRDSGGDQTGSNHAATS